MGRVEGWGEAEGDEIVTETYYMKKKFQLKNVTPPHHLAGRKAGPGVISPGKLILLLTGCNTRDRGPCTLPGQHNRADPIGVGTGDLTP